ncbi:unnamed protein product [Didymodactylos carnosus]|uniref:Uncharacterized protein n=1 Tax=Didymodactylos carnosus TaxID=1234261 RepID=A0A814EIP3_9BILA|nr:unnamed protein product [Didymodactylos carnosus]CAF1434048.1 unnamed protein product [Didymodactylos carnosus]CAF3741750.1 unnamed protein product [Didymodactylos carnosus]CAF4231692.1 unnamed protein product [Didymodactylos carnosus]
MFNSEIPLFSPEVQHRIKQQDLLLQKQLSYLSRESKKRLILYNKEAEDIRQSRPITQVSMKFNEIYDERTDMLDYDKIRQIGLNIGSPSQRVDAVPSDTSLHTKRKLWGCTKTTFLPPIVKSFIRKRSLNNSSSFRTNATKWMATFQRPNISEDNKVMFDIPDGEEILTLPNISPMQRQVRLFIEKLPVYSGTQTGFDSFRRSSFYTGKTLVVR